jgi:hypothetical protein
MSEPDRERAVRESSDHDLRAETGDRRRRPRHIALPPAARVWAFTLGLAFLALLLEVIVVERRPSGAAPIRIPWPLIAAGFCLAELKVVDVHFRREQHSFSLSEFPAVIGLFLLSSHDYLLAVLVGSAVALAWSRQTPLKFAFNLAGAAERGQRLASRRRASADRTSARAAEGGAPLGALRAHPSTAT